jgi:copper(I)-binding protein
MRLSSLHIGITAALLLTIAGGFATAKDYQLGALKVENPWTRATPRGAEVGGGYVTISNSGDAPDKLVGASFEDAGHVEIHEMTTSDGIMKMHAVPGGALDIKPGQRLMLKPGGYHFMLMSLKAPLKEGESVRGTLTFEKAGTLPVEFVVEGLGAQAPKDSEHHDMKDMK